MKGDANQANRTATLAIVLCTTILLAALTGLSLGCSPQGSTTSGDKGSDSDPKPTQSKPADNSDDTANQPVNWTMDIDCAICHTSEAEGVADTACAQAVAHEAEGLTCAQCHTDETVLTEAHNGITYADKPATKATVITVDPATCIACHGDLDEVAALTAGSEALKDSNGTVVNPHERPDGEAHDENPATCTDCHNNHSKDLSKDAMKYCAQCHHRGIFQCGTCHEIRERSVA